PHPASQKKKTFFFLKKYKMHNPNFYLKKIKKKKRLRSLFFMNGCLVCVTSSRFLRKTKQTLISIYDNIRYHLQH
ncbi:MAG: hypothetical protein ACTH88_08795, partial [Psychrobacter celer]